MTREEYLTALRKLKLTPAGKATAAALGLSLRHCQRIAAGRAVVPKPVAKLLTLLTIRHQRGRGSQRP